jgi:Sap, sulfolipid-1-addressing protein
MWGTVVLMAVVVAIDPAQVGGVAYILSRPRAMGLLVAYFIGGFGVSLIAGGVILFVLDGVGVGQGSSIPPEIEIAVGALALLVAALVGSGVAGRLRGRAKSRHTSDPAAASSGGGRPSLEKLPGLDKLPHRLQDALQNDSPWIAWIYGVGFGMPSAYYLAAIAAILKSGVGTGAQIGALLVFNLVAFAVAEIPLVSFAIAPEATRARLDQLYTSISTHHRLVVTILASIVGVYLIVVGISKL